MLGDLYQDLSEAARKKYALLQTPRFVEAFILDRTLTPAIETFGYRETTLIDPTCGSGHFLLGAFERLLELYEHHEPAVNERERVRRVLVADRRRRSEPVRHRDRALPAADRRAAGLRHRATERRAGLRDQRRHRRLAAAWPRDLPKSVQCRCQLDPDDPSHHHFATEDESVDRILGHQYHAVVGNPPYITVKDRALNDLYRQRYGSCHMKYSLVVPFIERFFELALRGQEASQAGFVGLIRSGGARRSGPDCCSSPTARATPPPAPTPTA